MPLYEIDKTKSTGTLMSLRSGVTFDGGMILGLGPYEIDPESSSKRRAPW